MPPQGLQVRTPRVISGHPQRRQLCHWPQGCGPAALCSFAQKSYVIRACSARQTTSETPHDDDPGDWSFTKEWATGGAWGPGSGDVVYSEPSDHGNGIVSSALLLCWQGSSRCITCRALIPQLSLGRRSQSLPMSAPGTTTKNLPSLWSHGLHKTPSSGGC